MDWQMSVILTFYLSITLGIIGFSLFNDYPVNLSLAYGVFWPIWLIRSIIRGFIQILKQR